jgi:hypothetical protein
MPLLGQVRTHIQEQPQRWQRVVQRVDQVCTPAQAERAVSILKPVIPREQWLTLVRQTTPRIAALALLLGYLDDRLAREDDISLDVPEPMPTWAEPWLHDWEVPHHDAPAEARAATLLRMLSRIVTIQRRLAMPVTQASDIGALAEAYVESGDVHLELVLALARKEADVIDDETRLGRLQVFFDSLPRRLIERLQTLDVAAGELIRHNVQGYLHHPRSTTRFLKPVAERARHRRQRLFVWLFDGMRYDT